MEEILSLDYFKNSEYFEKLKKFAQLLIEKNKKFNLTSIIDEKQIFVKHFFDSVVGERFLESGKEICEIGSGGGFPSVPLKLFNDGYKFTLIETTGKKCRYLQEVKQFFGFENFEVLNARCEEIAKKPPYRESFDFCVARAVAELNTLCEYMLPLVKVGGKVVCYKGSNLQEVENAKNALEILGGEIETIFNYNLPFDMGERNIVVIKKVKNTPPKYPRGQGKERSKPL